jgi:hypothetical protein
MARGRAVVGHLWLCRGGTSLAKQVLRIFALMNVRATLDDAAMPLWTPCRAAAALAARHSASPPWLRPPDGANAEAAEARHGA